MDGRVLVILAAILWGTTGTTQALAPADATPLAIGALRLLIGGTGLLGFALWRGDLPFTRDWLRPVTVTSGLMVALYQVTFFAAVARTGVAIGTLVALGSAPIFAGLLGRFLQGEQLSTRWMLATGFAIMGCALLFSGDGTASADLLGIVLAVGAGFSYALFSAMSKDLIGRFPANAVMAVAFFSGAVLLSPLLLREDLAWVLTVDGLLTMLSLGLLATSLAYFLYGQGLKTVSIAMAGTLTLAEPLTATLLGIFIVGEQLSARALLGVLVLFASLLALVIKRR